MDIPAFITDEQGEGSLKFFFDYEVGPTNGFTTLFHDGFGIRCEITREFEPGRYQFEVVKLDDFIKVWLDSNTTPTLDVEFPLVEIRFKNVELRDRHKVRVEFAEGAGLAELEFRWRLLQRLPDLQATPVPRPTRSPREEEVQP